jgi:hypothetical protein
MKPDNEFMLELTANMPCKQINITKIERADFVVGCTELAEAEYKTVYGYIQRYYAGKFVNQIGECDLWFHRFLSGDGDEHLHWHPMNMRSSVLCGSYREEYLCDGEKLERVIYPGDASRNFLINLCAKASLNHPLRKIPDRTRRIGMHDIHRIAEVEPGTWSMLLVDPERVPVWGFIDDDGEIETRPTSGRDWWKNYKPRGMNKGDVL